jgi:hypothetical protein
VQLVGLYTYLRSYTQQTAAIAETARRLGYGLDDQGIMVRFLLAARNVSLLYQIWTEITFYTAVLEDVIPGVKR